MLEIIWRLRSKVLSDESELRAVIAALAQLPGLNPSRYDLNRKGQWRPYELKHTVVDALTQRTQLLVIQGANATGGEPGAQAMIALGKHGEQPTVIAQLPDGSGVARELVEGWGDLYEALALESTLLMSGARRAALDQAGVDAANLGGALAMAWHPAHIPAGLRTLEHARLAATPISLQQYATHWRLDLGLGPIDAAQLAPECAYRGALEALNRALDGK